MRGLLIVLLLLSTGVFALQRYLEPLTIRVLEQQLEDSNIQLLALKLGTVKPGIVRIDKIGLAGESWHLEASGVTVVIFPDGEVSFDAQSVAVNLLGDDSDSSKASTGEQDNEAQTVEEIFASVNSSLSLLPASGRIKALEYCQPGTCLLTTINWRRYANKLSAELNLPDYGVYVDLHRQESWRLELQVTNDTLVGQGQIQVLPTDDLMVLNHSGIIAPVSSIEFDPLSAVVERIAVQGDARLPMSTYLDQLVSEVLSDNRFDIDASNAANIDNASLSSAGRHSMSVAYIDQDLLVKVDEFPSIAFDVVNVGTGLVNLDAAIDCEVSLGLGAASCVVEGVTISSEATVEDNLFAADLKFSELTIEFSQGDIEANGQLGIDVFDLNNGVEVLAGGLGFNVVSDEIRIVAENLALLGAKVSLSLKSDISGQSGNLQVSSQGDDKMGAVMEYAAGLLEENDLVAAAASLNGTHSFHSNMRWSSSGDEIEHSTEVSLDEVSIVYDGYTIGQGSLESHLSGWPIVSTSMAVTADTIDVGVPLEGFRLSLDATFDSINQSILVAGDTLSFEAFGGSVTSDRFDFESSTLTGGGLVSLSKIELGALLALQEQDIQATGLLSGSVPVQISNGKLHFNHANIQAQAPGGFIQYRAEESVKLLARDNTGVSVVLDAMENFQYHTLGADVDFGLDGQMIARTSLKGANPDYQNGREVHLNLRLEENVLTLLKSLRLGTELADKIGRERF